MKDAMDIDDLYDAFRNAGLRLPARPRAEDTAGRVNYFMKREADRRGRLCERRKWKLDEASCGGKLWYYWAAAR